MPTVDVADLQRRAAALIRRAAAGETITIAANGREVAELSRARRNSWRSWAETAAVFDGPADPDWAEDRATLDGSARDPFSAW